MFYAVLFEEGADSYACTLDRPNPRAALKKIWVDELSLSEDDIDTNQKIRLVIIDSTGTIHEDLRVCSDLVREIFAEIEADGPQDDN
jgi:enoyl-CoA hydratase/carnithine racemase